MFPAFVASGFAIAGALLMFGPALIHLLSRHRYRTIEWGAMDFLIEAMQSNRRLLRVRDWLLLILRAAALLLFGLALARPYLAERDAVAHDRSRPPHAILVIDNSLSSSLQTLSGTVLEESKTQAKEFLENLPSSSQISVVPLCDGSASRISDPYRSRSDAADAIDRIAATHAGGELSAALNAARRLAEQTPALASTVVIFGDQQTAPWQQWARNQPSDDYLPVILVPTISGATDNLSVDALDLSDGMAEVGAATQVTARVRYQGSQPRTNVGVTFLVHDAEVETQFLDFPAGDSVQTVRFDYIFRGPSEGAFESTGVPVTVKVPGDALAADDARSLVVPLVESAPIVFIDQWSDDEESPTLGRVGETWFLRQLLAPQTSELQEASQVVRPIHLSQRQADPVTLEAALREARLAVVAGIEAPSPPLVQLLRQFVQQGGQLIIAAGGAFDPAQWTEQAWLDGRGILPRPLKPMPIGHSLTEPTDQLQLFRIATKGLLDHVYFRLANLEENQLIDLYADPLFFKAVVPDPDISPTSDGEPEAANQATWLAWQPPLAAHNGDMAFSSEPEGQSVDMPATTLAQFDNGVEFVVERSVGKGRVTFFSSGVSTDWSTLPGTNAVLIFDRILRSQLASTLPRHNFEVGQVALLSLPTGTGDAAVQLALPESSLVQSLAPRFLDDRTRGVRIENLDTSGIYWLSPQTAGLPNAATIAGPRNFRIPLAVQAPAWESDLARLDRPAFEKLDLPASFEWYGDDPSFGTAGLASSGYTWWKWLMGLMIGLLLTEMTVAAMPSWLAWLLGRSSTGPAPTTTS